MFVGFSCNNNCVFCSANSFNKSKNNRSTEEVASAIVNNASDYDLIEFLGGEFTIRKDAIQLISLAKKAGYKKISLETNGRMLSNKKFAEKIIKAGLDKISFSLHGSNSKTHDKLTQTKDSFNQALQGISNACELGAFCTVTFVINQLNYKEIPAFVKLIGKYPLKSIMFNYMRPEQHLSDQTLKNYLCAYSKTVPYVKQVGQNKKTDNNTNLFGSLERSCVKLDRCKVCLKNKVCIGIWKRYLDIYGDKEFQPV